MQMLPHSTPSAVRCCSSSCNVSCCRHCWLKTPAIVLSDGRPISPGSSRGRFCTERPSAGSLYSSVTSGKRAQHDLLEMEPDGFEQRYRGFDLSVSGRHGAERG